MPMPIVDQIYNFALIFYLSVHILTVLITGNFLIVIIKLVANTHSITLSIANTDIFG